MDQTQSTLDGTGQPLAASSMIIARIGRYPVLRKLGQGGMGVVYAAYDDMLDRKLAIKLLRVHSREGPRRVRMLREAQALARLSHPNVVQIYEAGEHGDGVFMAMEFVAGQTLGAWLETRPRSRAQILEAFTAAGRGLEAAHAARLIHRDFKPDNVMIADDGTVKVMDFGLVRAEDASEPEGLATEELDHSLTSSQDGLGVDLTKTGAVMGTPAYMAPEQHFGRPTDARTDQFSFCVALWEALYGTRPFAGESIAALAFNVTRGKITELPRDATVPGWLRKVVERGLALDPAARWPSMEALLAALANDPTRLRWTGLGLLGVVAVSVGAWSWQQAERARTAQSEQDAQAQVIAACEGHGRTIDEVWNEIARRQIEQAFARSKLAFASDAWQRTRANMDEYAEAWTSARSRTCVASELDGTLDAMTAARAVACLDERKAALASLVALLGEADDARILRAVSSAAELPLLTDCDDSRKLAHSRPLPEQPELRARAEALRERLARIDALDTMGEFEAGAREAAAALAEAEALGWAPLIAAANLAVGRLAAASGDFVSARAAYEQAMVVAGRAGDDALVLDAAVALVYAVGVGLDNPDDGLRIARLAEVMLARLGETGSLIEAALHNNVGTIHERRSEADQALAEFERALVIYQAALPPAHPSISIVLNNIGTIHGRQGRLDQALAYFERTLQIRTASLPPGHPRLAAAHENIGHVHLRAGAYELAMAALERALAINEANLPPEHLDIANNLINLGGVHFEREDYAAAEPLYRRGLAIRTAVLPPESRLLGAAHNNLGLTLARLERADEAIEHLSQALAIYEVALAGDDPRLAELRSELQDLRTRASAARSDR
jgi:tetratricopeptide (TPR) repeat protein/predicted Ser/Thr protein kinase